MTWPIRGDVASRVTGLIEPSAEGAIAVVAARDANAGLPGR